MKQTHNLQSTTNNQEMEKGERSTARLCEKELNYPKFGVLVEKFTGSAPEEVVYLLP